MALQATEPSAQKTTQQGSK